MPGPFAEASNSSPAALAKSALPSARKLILPSLPEAFAQAERTKGALTEAMGIASTPLALLAASWVPKPGGGAKRTIFLPLRNSAVVTGRGPSLVIRRNVTSGRGSPTLIVMTISLGLRERAAGSRLFYREPAPAQTGAAILQGFTAVPKAIVVSTGP